MKKAVITTVIKTCGEAILLTIVVGIVIGIIGSLKGCLVIIAGAATRWGASQEWNTYRSLYADSFRDMSPGERADFIVDASSSVRLVILGVLGGVLLILTSALVTRLF
jgi:hypothetical protein